jgi:hypothetical protein
MNIWAASEKMRPEVDIIDKEIEVLEISQYTHIGYKAEDEPVPARLACAFFNLQAREIIDNNSAAQYDYIYRYEGHVEVATGNQQQPNTLLLVLQPEKQEGDDEKKNQELERIKQHTTTRCGYYLQILQK